VIDITTLSSTLQAVGNTLTQTLQGTEGFDWMAGGSGSDVIESAGGDDILNGLDGNDHLVGGLGNDLLAGGAGDDIFTFRVGDGEDRIFDFEVDTGDRVDLREHALGTFASVQDIAVQFGADTVLQFNESDKLTLVGVDSFELAQDDLLL